MQKLIWLIVIVGSLVLSCVSTRRKSNNYEAALRPPTHSQVKGENASNKSVKNEIWFINYKQAQAYKDAGQFDLSCALFKALASDKVFPLNELAKIRSIEICPLEKQESADINNIIDYKKFPDWLSEEAFELQLNLAKDTRNDRQIVELLIESSKKSLPKREKVHRMLVAIELAEKNNFADLLPAANERLLFLAPRYIVNPAPQRYMDVADDFRQEMDFDKAISYYLKVIRNKKLPSGSKFSALKGIARTYKLKRKKEEFVLWTGKAATHAKKMHLAKKNNLQLQYGYYKAQLDFVRALWTENQYGRAWKSLANLETYFKNLQKSQTKQTERLSLAEVYWLMGRMKEERQEFKSAGDYFALAAQEPIADTDFKEKVGWHLAWNLIKTKSYELAAKTLDELIASTKNPFRKSRFSFWMAKSLLASGENSRARQLLNEITIDDSVGYYGIMASRELKRPIGFPEYDIYDLKIYEPTTELSIDFSPLIVDWLISLNEKQVAKSYLETHRQILLKRDSVSDETWLYMYHLYARTHLHNELFSSLYSLNPDQRKRILNLDPELLFPKPFNQTVVSAGQKYSVKTELIYSIMRQESAFNPEARSHADAFGLMQLLPDVAKTTSETRDLNYKQPTDLFNPQINIPIGAAFINELHKKYQDRILLVAASYNASDEAINGWLKTRYRGDTVEFIEDIPFEETQDYLKLILRNYIFYSVIENNSKPIEFPEWLLDLGFSDT